MLFLNWLEKYDLLIELVITLLTITLSLVAVFQTKKIAKKQLEQEERIAKQQASLQEKQIRISVYQQKDKINRTLRVVFDTTAKIRLLYDKVKIDELEQRKLYDVLKGLVRDVDFEDISYTLEQSHSFLSADIYREVEMIRIYFSIIDTSIECLDLLKDPDIKAFAMKDIIKSCEGIKSFQDSIDKEMIQELQLL